MKLTDFDYNLPKSFIAQNPTNPRDLAKLFVFDVSSSTVTHKVFRDIYDYFRAGDVLVLNNSKVIKARIVFSHQGKELEIFILKKISDCVYECMVKPGKKFKKGGFFVISSAFSATVVGVNEDGTRVIQFSSDDVEEYGKAPFPPYIDASNSSLDDYQTVYAKEKGSVASPTAGLHFTPELLSKIRSKGVIIAEVMLHVGLGTFLPVKTDEIEKHEMHNEFFTISPETCNVLNMAKVEGRRIIAVGTTSVRVIESSFKDGEFEPFSGETNIFIYPGYKWKAVDSLITNFHLPKSTLLMLVSSFIQDRFPLNGGSSNSDSGRVPSGASKILELYEIAKTNGYRFYSFGDAMFIANLGDI